MVFIVLLGILGVASAALGILFTAIILIEPRKDLQRRDALKWTIPLAVGGLALCAVLMLA